MSPHALLTPTEVAAELRLSLSSVYAMCDSGELPCHRVGMKKGRIRVTRSALDKYLRQMRENLEPQKVTRKPRQPVQVGQSLDFLRSLGYSG